MEEEKILEKRKERRKEFLDWDIEKDLPLHVGPYDLERTDEQEGRIYQAFRWIDRSSGWQIKAVFDEEISQELEECSEEDIRIVYDMVKALVKSLAKRQH